MAARKPEEAKRKASERRIRDNRKAGDQAALKVRKGLKSEGFKHMAATTTPLQRRTTKTKANQHPKAQGRQRQGKEAKGKKHAGEGEEKVDNYCTDTVAHGTPHGKTKPRQASKRIIFKCNLVRFYDWVCQKPEIHANLYPGGVMGQYMTYNKGVWRRSRPHTKVIVLEYARKNVLSAQHR